MKAIILAKNIHDIHFVFFKRSVNDLADKTVKKILHSYRFSCCI